MCAVSVGGQLVGCLRNTEADFHGKKRSNETHVSTTDPDARLYRKGPGKEAKLCFIGHGLMESCSGTRGTELLGSTFAQQFY